MPEKDVDTSCSASKYKCCDDNTTAAHGPNKEGCCLNTVRPIFVPESFELILILSFILQEFGCCADNIIPKQGPNGEGCGCMESPWKCCPDNTTAATPTGCGCKFRYNLIAKIIWTWKLIYFSAVNMDVVKTVTRMQLDLNSMDALVPHSEPDVAMMASQLPKETTRKASLEKD